MQEQICILLPCPRPGEAAATRPTRPGREEVPGRAGPGDRGLLTVRAAELIASADVILYDRLIPPDALSGARPDAPLQPSRGATSRSR